VDKRADIWAFGCVLYEMLTGRRVFEAEEVSDTLALVLTKDPDWSALPSDTPPAIRRLLRRCLTKDRQSRLPDVGSARLEIDEARTEPQSPPAHGHTPTSAARRWSAGWAVTTVVAALIGAFVTWIALGSRSAADPPVTRLFVGVAPAERLLSGFQGDAALAQGRPSRTAMAISADGRSIVFSAERDGRVQLFLRRLDQLDATPIPGTEGASNPFLSPDGEWLGFHAGGALHKVPLAGGPAVELCKADLVYGATWSRSNQIVFARQSGGLWQVSSAGGTATQATALDTEAGDYSHRLPHVLPNGETVVFTVTRSLFPSWDDDTLVVAQSLATGARTVVIEGGADARFVAPGHLLYLRRGTLMAVPFDPARLEITGAHVGVASDVMQAAGIQPVQVDTGAGQFAVSASGSLVYITGGTFRQDRWSLVWANRAGETEPLDLPPGAYLGPRLSPDGTHAAFTIASGDWDIATYDLTRRSLSRLAMDGEQSVALWTPAGSRLAFSSFGKSVRGLFWRPADGTGGPEPLTAASGWPISWTPDGKALIVVGAAIRGDLSVVALEGTGEPKPFLASPAFEGMAEFSPDGKWLAFSSGPNLGAAQVYVRPYPSLDRQHPVSAESGSTSPAWRRDGRELYYVEDDSADGPLKVRLMAVPITTSPTFSAGTPRVLFEGAFRIDGPFRGYDVTPDGQRFLMVQEVPVPPARVSQMVLVQNWTEELKRR
jgi:serine/threonine-protein kinase